MNISDDQSGTNNEDLHNTDSASSIHHWENLDVPEVFKLLDSREAGLSSEEAAHRLAEVGPNILAEEEKINIAAILLHQFRSPLIYVLIVAAIVTFFLHEYIDMGVIIAVIVLNAVIGFFQEFKAELGVRSLRGMVKAKARVFRDERIREIDGEDLVPGDVVHLAAGMKVPADIRLVHLLELRIDESMLTGESTSVEKLETILELEDLTPGDQVNMAFMGTSVVHGRGRGVVVETGPRTIIGDIAGKVREIRVGKAPLQIQLERFAAFLSWTVGLVSLAIFFVGLMHGKQLSEMFVTAVAVAVSAIPEGLPVAVTIAMAIGVSRMAARNTIIRRLASVETLGSTTVIGSDKTGTITKNEMSVQLVYDGDHTYEASGAGYDPAGQFFLHGTEISVETIQPFAEVLRAGMLCNEADIYQEDGSYKVEGDPTEGALIVAAIKGGLNPDEEESRFPQLGLMPFDSERRFMATLHKSENENLLYVKGAPEKVLGFCAGHEDDMAGTEEILNITRQFAAEGLRVLAMARKNVPSDITDIMHVHVESDLQFVGLQGMYDPPRPEVEEAVRQCRNAGVRTLMITGDHAETAKAVAYKIGIIESTEDEQVLEGRRIEGMSDEELFEAVGTVSLYARVAPIHKLRIVQQLMARGEIVAVTGDGVNDAPALKAAHIGVSMGRGGTDVAKEASDAVLSDDNFASIVAAIYEGRVVYENIKKVTLFLVSCGFGELLAIIATMVMNLPLPYIPAQILWLNLVTNGFQDVALAFEPGDSTTLCRPPRPPGERILSSFMVRQTLLMGSVMGVGTLFIFMLEYAKGVPLDSARSVALTTMVFFQFYQAFNCRSENRSVFVMNPFGNPFLFVSVIGAFFAHLAVLHVPVLQYIFRTVPLSAGQWLDVLLVSSVILIVVEVDKLVRNRSEKTVTESC
jgi:Ca2+-transporting ATPase